MKACFRDIPMVFLVNLGMDGEGASVRSSQVVAPSVHGEQKRKEKRIKG